MTAGDQPQPSAPHARLARGIVAAALLLALILRLAGIGAFAVVGEDALAAEATAFYNAVRLGEWGQTARPGQPAVVSRWLGGVAAGLQASLRHGAPCPALTSGHDPLSGACAIDERSLLTALHVGTALTTWLLLALCAAWLWRLLRPAQAALAVALLAFDPFLLGYARLAGGEALLAYLLLGSCLSLAVALRRGRKGLFVLSALLGGLALAERLVGSYGLIVAGALLGQRLWRQERCGLARARRWLVQLGLWALLALMTVLAVWPALWRSPLAALRLLWPDLWAIVATLELASQHYLLGSVLTADATALLYALTLLFRLTPLTLIGLGLALTWADWRNAASDEISPWLLFGLGFMLLQALGIRQHGSVVLTALAGFAIAAALALWRLAERTVARKARQPHRRPGLALIGLPLAALLYLLPTAPYYLTSYNWLLGGAPVAVHAIDVGSGEGLDRAGAYLSALPGSERLTVASDGESALRPYLHGSSHPLSYESAYRSDYVVFYVNDLQRHPGRELWLAYAPRQPLHEVRMQGIVYARIYAVERPARALAELQSQANANELVVAEIDSLLARDYAGAAPLWLPPPDSEPLAVRDNLLAALEGREAVWWVIYPEARGPYADMVREVMERATAPLDEQRYPDLRLERRAVHLDWLQGHAP